MGNFEREKIRNKIIKKKKKNVNKSLLGKKVSRLYDSLLRNKKRPPD